jgi:glycogen operon protein
MEHQVFRRRGWFLGKAIHGSGVEDIGWFAPNGEEMAGENWGEGFAKSIGVFLNGNAIPYPDPRGERVVDDSFLVLLSAHHDEISFTLPGPEWGREWSKVIDTAEGGFVDDGEIYEALDEIVIQGRSLAVLKRSESDG